MKATNTILAAIFTLQAGILFAGNDTFSTSATNDNFAIFLTALAPSTPEEATFEDVNENTFDFAFLAPVVPNEADFNDVAPEASIDVMNLVPVTPAEADFNDAPLAEVDVHALAPIAPAAADFE